MGFLMTTEVNECWVFSWVFLVCSVSILYKKDSYMSYCTCRFYLFRYFLIMLCLCWNLILFFEIYFWKWCQRFDCFYFSFSWCIEFLELWRTGVLFIHKKSMLCWERLRMALTFWEWLIIVEEVVVKSECLKNLLGVEKRNFAGCEGWLNQVFT